MLRAQRRRAAERNHKLHEKETNSQKGELYLRVALSVLFCLLTFGILFGHIFFAWSKKGQKKSIVLLSTVVTWQNKSAREILYAHERYGQERNDTFMPMNTSQGDTKRLVRIWNRAARCALSVSEYSEEVACMKNEDGTVFELIGDRIREAFRQRRVLQVVPHDQTYRLRAARSEHNDKESYSFEIVNTNALRHKATGGCLTVIRPEGQKYSRVMQVRARAHRHIPGDCTTQLSVFQFQWIDSELKLNQLFAAERDEAQRKAAEVHMIQDTRTRWLNSTEKRVIAYGLYGNDPKYTIGAIRNSELIHTIFPGWTARFYIQSDVPPATISTLRANGAEIYTMGNAQPGKKIAGMFWRFLIADDHSVDRFLIRDTDSRLNFRERAAVDEWIQSKKAIHSIRDHPGHNRPLNGGLWGGTKNCIPGGITDKILQYSNKNSYGSDQVFLKMLIWPLVQDNQLSHDAYSCSRYPNSLPFPTRRPPNFQHVGQVFNANDEPRMTDIDTFIKNREVPLECRRYPDWKFG